MAIEYKYITSLCIFLLAPIYAFAQEEAKIENYISIENFTGTYSCHGENYISHAQIETELEDTAKHYTVKISSRKSDAFDSTIQNLSADNTDTTNIILLDENNNTALKITKQDDGDVFTAQWLQADGSVKQDCASFKLKPNRDFGKNFQALIEQLQQSSATLDNAETLAKIQFQSPPTVFLDPETFTRYQQASNDFWSKFYKAELEKLQNLATNTPQQTKAFIEEAQNAASIYLNPNGIISKDKQDISQKFAHDIVILANDRINSQNRLVSPLNNYKASDIAKRYQLIGNDTIENWELISGLAVEYWGRYLQQHIGFNQQYLIKELQSVAQINAIESLKNIWPEIEKRANNGQFLLQQIKKIQNTPENIEAYKNSNYLQIDQEELKKRGISAEIYQRIVGDKLAIKAANMQKTLQENINTSFATKTELAEFTPLEIASHCQNLLGYTIEDQSPLKKLYDECSLIGEESAKSLLEDKFSKIIEIATDTNKISSDKISSDSVALLLENQWLDAHLIAAPLSLDDDYLPKQQQKLASLQKNALQTAAINIPKQFAKIDFSQENPAILNVCASINNTDLAALAHLKQICTNEILAYKDKRKKYQCDKAVESANLEQSMLNKDIYFDMVDTSPRIKLRTLICRLGLLNTSTKVTKTGQWAWSKHFIEFSQKTADGKEKLIQKALLAPMKTGLRMVDMTEFSTIYWLKSLDIFDK